MIRLSFNSAATFAEFLDEVKQQLGRVPGEPDHTTLSLRMSPQDYAQDAPDLVEMVRDYGGRISHVSV